MTRKRVSDAERGQLASRLFEVLRRADEGSIPFNPVMETLQGIIEGKFDHIPEERFMFIGSASEIAI